MITKDKQLHLYAGFIIGLFGCLVVAPWFGLLLSGLAGAAKEGYDYVINQRMKEKGLPDAHDVDFFDYMATQAGGAVACIFFIMLGRL